MPPKSKKAKIVNKKATNEDPDISADIDEEEDITLKRKKPSRTPNLPKIVNKKATNEDPDISTDIDEEEDISLKRKKPSRDIDEEEISPKRKKLSQDIDEEEDISPKRKKLSRTPNLPKIVNKKATNEDPDISADIDEEEDISLKRKKPSRALNLPKIIKQDIPVVLVQKQTVPSGLGHTHRQPLNVPSGLGHTYRQPINVPSVQGHTLRQPINVPSGLDHTCEQLKNVPSGPEHTYLKKLLLFILLVISILFSYSIYNNMNTEIQTLQLHTHNLQGKVNQLETVSNDKFSSLLGDTKTYTASVEKMSKIEEMVKNTSNTANAIDLFFQSKIKEFEVLEKDIFKINEKLKKEKSDLDFMVEEIGEVKKERGEIEMVKRLAESCLALHNNLTFEMKNITEMTTKMEKLSKNSSFLRQEHSRFSQKLQEFDTKLTEKNNLLNTRISTINSDLGTESLRLNKLKLLLDTLQEKQGDISTMESKLDKAQQSVSHIEEDLIKHDEKIEKYQKEFPSISKIPKRVQTLDETIEKISKDIEDKWVLIQGITVAFVITILSLCGGLMYSRKKKIDEIEKKIKYLTENKDKPSLQYESLSIVEQIKRRQPEELENKFCVISFSQETHNKHRRITRPSVEGRLRIKKMDEADFVVTNDKSALKIPHCKVILVFVDHNQKDVILETPGEDEEDIKLLTVQACRKMGADVFVIYVGDEGSESLMAGCLYNPQLTTVAEHFELKQLESRNRVITCHEKLTITQREKVAQAIA